MALYQYRNPKTKEAIEVYQSMTEKHQYFDENGLEWIREFSVPRAQIDTNIDPMSKRDFIEKTRKKNYNFGEVSDLSAEASLKREKKMGRDEVKEAAMVKYEKATKKPHPGRPRKTKFEI